MVSQLDDNKDDNRIAIDWKKVDELLMAGCLGTEIAAYFGMHPDTFYIRVEKKYGMGFSQFRAEKKSKGEALIRATQYAKALGLTDKGDNTLLIWLGKQRLDQRDHKEDATQAQKVIFEVNYKNDAQNSVEILPEAVSDSTPSSSQ